MSWAGAGLSLLLLASALPAQRDSISLHGTVLDRGTGSPVAGAYLAFLVEARGWTIADSLGRFTLSPSVRGHQSLLVTCPRPRDVWGETLDTVVVDLHSPLDTTFAIAVTDARCNLPAFAERRLDLGGYFSVGFEENRFFPDPDSLGQQIIWGGNVASRHAEVSWSVAGRAQRPPWPSHDGAAASSYCYRVHWIGTLTGPGAKFPTPAGTIPVGRIAAFTFAVDSTISVEAAPVSRCTRR
jgi:hypothetical protein